MKKYKVCVYAICKNEEAFVKRWVDSMKEADDIFVLDTGSTDQSVKQLQELGVNVKVETINPWRFDEARNQSLKMVPEDTDICVCTDLDEVFEPGWRKNLEQLWDQQTTRLAYLYNWSLDEEGKPLVHFYIEKIHNRKDYTWTHPVHEILTYKGQQIEQKKTTEQIVLNHYPDKKKSRSSYLPLLELSVKEDPEDDRNMHYLGREYMYYQKWKQAINTFHRHLNLKRAVWKDERCASMRFMGRCYQALGYTEEAKMWFKKAIEEAPYLRDPYMERALLSFDKEEWEDTIFYTLQALKIKEHTKSYIHEIFSWNETPFDLLSIAYYQLEDYDLAIFYCQKALLQNPKEKRLQNNLKFMQKEKE